MKSIIALMILLVSFSSFAQTVRNCKEMEKRFPGTIQLVMGPRFAEKVLYAETDKSGFKEIEKVEPNPQNRYFRGGSEYFITLKTSKKTYEGKLSLNTTGDEIQFYTDDEAYYFLCDY